TQDRVDRAHILERVGALTEALAPGFDLMWLVGAPILGDPLLHDHMRGRRKSRRAAGMIAMVLADDDVADGLAGHRFDEILQEPRLRRVVAGIDHDHTLARHHHQRIGVVALADEGVDAIGDLLELSLLAGDRLRLLREQSEGQQHKSLHDSHGHSSLLAHSRIVALQTHIAASRDARLAAMESSSPTTGASAPAGRAAFGTSPPWAWSPCRLPCGTACGCRCSTIRRGLSSRRWDHRCGHRD